MSRQMGPRKPLSSVLLCMAMVAGFPAACNGSDSDPSEAKESAGGNGGTGMGEPPSGATSEPGITSHGGAAVEPSGGGAAGTEDETAVGGAAGTADSSTATGGDGATCEFQPCGGDPKGHWKWASACQDGTNPVAACPEATFIGTITLDYPIDISASSWTRNRGGNAKSEIHVPRACYDNKTCEQIYPNPRQTEVVSEESGVCVIKEEVIYPPESYSNSITIGNDSFKDTAGREVQFCVQGDRLQIKSLDDNPFAFVHTFERD